MYSTSPIGKLVSGRTAKTRRSAAQLAAWLTRGLHRKTIFHMVKYPDVALSRTFGALVDETRRRMLAHLEREGGVSVSALAAPFAITLPGILKHLDVLEQAGLISRTKQGRTVTVQLRADPLKRAADWLHRYERFWSPRLDKLTAYAERQERKASKSR
jgi:DNA-binding transcriptional ArsR family regulator